MEVTTSTMAPKFSRLVFPPERKLYQSDIPCLFDNDSFSEILNEDFDSYVLNPWAWTKDGGTTVKALFLPVVATITIATNILFVSTFIREKMISATSVILIAIGVSDSLTVLIPSCAAVYMYVDGEFPDYIPYNYCRLWGYLTKYLPTITHNASVWLTLVLAIQRYLIISKPLHARRICVKRSSVSAIILIYVLAILSQLCRFLDTEYVPVKIVSAHLNLTTGQNVATENSSQSNFSQISSFSGEEICNSTKALSTCRAIYTAPFESFGIWYEFYYYWFVILFVKFIPCICLIVLDTLMLKGLRNSETFRQSTVVYAGDNKLQSARKYRRESRRMTIILVIVIIIVIVVELPIGVILVLWTLEMIHATSTLEEETLSTMARIANSIIYTSYPVIFILYSCMCVKFRRALCRICRSKKEQKQLVSTSSTH